MIHRKYPKKYDAVVVGARCAGAATAMLLARQGLSVLLAEKETDPKDALSTHALMRPAVALLGRWGVLDQIVAADTPAIQSTTFHYGEETVTVPIKPVSGGAGLYAPRRFLLDKSLRDAAVASGADLALGMRFTGLLEAKDGRAAGATFVDRHGMAHAFVAPITIGADGGGSSVAQVVRAPVLRESPDRSATLYGYFRDIEADGHAWMFEPGLAAGLIPTNHGEHCAFVFCPPTSLRQLKADDAQRSLAKLISRWDTQAGDAIAGHTDARLYQFNGRPGYMRRCAGPGWALVGDAGYFRDPASAHGISDAFLDADRLARAIAASPADACGYLAERDALSIPIFETTQRIASFNWTVDHLKSLHADLSRQVRAEVAALDAMPPMLIAA